MESARRFMKDGLIVNHTSALGLNPNPKMLEYSAASAAVINASLAFGVNKMIKIILDFS